MKKLIVATAAAILLGAPLALAGSTTTTTTTPAKPETKNTVVSTSLSDQCTALGKQFDEVQAKHKSNKNYKEALELRATGKSLCTSQKEADGVKKIEAALNMIGVKPKM